MEEEKQNEKKEEQKPNFMESLNKAEQLTLRLEEANKKAEEILIQNQELAARNILGGQTNAGKQPPEKKEETPREYAKRMLGGG